MLGHCKRAGLTALAYTIMLSPALAEVCDKVDPDWNPADGPLSPIGALVDFFLSPFGIVAIALVVFSWALDNRWLAWLTATLLVVAAVGLSVDWLYLDDVGRFAVQEGCRASPILIVVVLCAAAGLLVARRLVRLKPRA